MERQFSGYTDVENFFPRYRKGYREQRELIHSSGFTEIPDRFEAEEVKRSSEAPIQWIPVDKLIAGQGTVDADRIYDYLDIINDSQAPPIIAIEVEGGYMVWNGHHRAASHILAGKRRIKARVYKRPQVVA